ncbi:MAG TPA: HD domain-containing protein, partial [Bacteroidales bacterium]|nr:HD domain-containing protein [Bacteroidales bacterium]
MSETPINYYPILISSLNIETSFSFKLFIKYSGFFLLYKAEKSILEHKDLARLQNNDIKYLYILKDEKILYVEYLEQRIDDIFNDESLTEIDKAEALYNSSLYYIEEVYTTIKFKEENLEHYLTITRVLITSLLSNPEVIAALFKIFTHSSYEYGHAVQVTVLAIILGYDQHRLELDELSSLALSALVHDVGKVYIDKSIINKPSLLSSSELALIKKHPAYSYQYLKEKNIIEDLVLTTVHDHHESLDG